jgi:hypothetical protein
MENFTLTKKMLTISGVFYPTGYVFIMFPNANDAAQVAAEISAYADPQEQPMLLTPQNILREIGKLDGDSDIALPSVGTEGATVNKYIQLARLGHHAVMAKVSSDEYADRVMVAVRKVSFSYGQRYHLLAIEDLEP